MEFPGTDGFLGTRASLMLDIVFLAMFIVLPVLGLSVYLVKFRRQYQLHKRLQIGLAILVGVTVALFELDVRIHDWRPRAAASPYYADELTVGLVNWSLWIHLVFAVSTPLVWVFVIVQALRYFPRPPVPGAYSRRHIGWARLAVLDMLLTAVTGWVFYYLAFVAT